MEKSDYNAQPVNKENGTDYPSKDERVKEKVVYKVVPVPYYYPVPVDAEWYYKHYEPPMRNGGNERGVGYHGYEDSSFEHFPFPPPSAHGFPAPPRSRDFHYYPVGGGREEMERYWRPVSPLYRSESPGREQSPPTERRPAKESSSDQNGERTANEVEKRDQPTNQTNGTASENNEENKDKTTKTNENDDAFEARSVKSEGNASSDNESAKMENKKDDNLDEEESRSPKSDSESNRKRKRYMMAFPYDQRKKNNKDGGEFEKGERNGNTTTTITNNNSNNNSNSNSIDAVEDINIHEPVEHKRMRAVAMEDRERVYMKQKSYPSSGGGGGGGTNGHYPYHVMMRSPPYGGEVGRPPKYPQERSYSMYEARRYEDSYKEHDLHMRNNSNDMDEDDKKEIRYHPNGRRARTVFTRQQLLTLNNVFDKHPFVSGERMSELSDQLGLDRKIVKIWFQNKRQYARKKGSLVERNEEYYYDYQDPYNPSSAPPTMAERWKN